MFTAVSQYKRRVHLTDAHGSDEAQVTHASGPLHMRAHHPRTHLCARTCKRPR